LPRSQLSGARRRPDEGAKGDDLGLTLGLPREASAWRTNMATLSLENSIGRMVMERPSRARVFEKFGLDYCCNGKVPLGEACARKGVPTNAVLRDLEASDEKVTLQDLVDWSQASLSQIIEDVLSVHHAYLR